MTQTVATIDALSDLPTINQRSSYPLIANPNLGEMRFP